MTTTSASAASSVGLVAGLLEQPGHPLGVVDVHLAAERFDQVFTRHALPFAFRSFAFAFRLRFAFRLSRRQALGAWRFASISRAEARSPSVTARPAQHPRRALRRGRRRRAASTVVRVRPPLDPLLDQEVRVGVRGDLRQVRDAEHLERRPERAQLPADDVGDAAADAGVDLVEDQPGRRRARRPVGRRR